MKALEFKSKIKGNQILIPERIQAELNSNQAGDVRVIILMDDSDLYDDLMYRQSAKNEFLKGYAESDSIYDTY